MKKIFSRVSAAKINWMWFSSLVLLLPLTARADVNESGAVEIGPFIGYNFFQPPQNLRDNLLYGARASYNFSELFALEGTIEFSNTSVYDSTITGSTEGQFLVPHE